jgi:hypothetical protein
MKTPAWRALFSDKKRIGQSLVEFALMLPILLLLFFGIIEFARIFHAWLTVEHSAREAARYAVSGQYNEAYCQPGPDGISTPLTNFEPNAFPGGVSSYAEMDIHDGAYDCRVTSDAPGVTDVDPDDYWHFQNVTARMQDAARLYSMRDVARNASRTIAIDESVSGDITRNNDLGHPITWDADQRGYFHVVVCSTRSPFVFDRETDYNLTTSHDMRYACIFDEDQVRNTGDEVLRDDSGGPNDRVVVAVSFNHPLITPIRGIANNAGNYIPLHSIREMVVERFRTARVIGLPPAFDIPDPPTNTPLPPEPPIVDIIYPVQNPPCITETLRLQARACDPDDTELNCDPNLYNGEGIERVRFWVRDPTGTNVSDHTEGVPEYCGNGGDSDPCPAIDLSGGYWPSGRVVAPGVHTLYVIARDNDGQETTVAREFEVCIEPDCDDITLDWYGFYQDDSNTFVIQNNSSYRFDITNFRIWWPYSGDDPRLQLLYMGYLGQGNQLVANPEPDIRPDINPPPADINSFETDATAQEMLSLDPVSGPRRVDIDYNQYNIYEYNPYDFQLEVTLETSFGFPCTVYARGPDVPATCDMLHADPDGVVHFGYGAWSGDEDEPTTPYVINETGYRAWLDQFTIHWPDQSPAEGGFYADDGNTYMDQAYMGSEGDRDRIHSGNASISPWTETWTDSSGSRNLNATEPHVLQFDPGGQESVDLRNSAFGIDRAPRAIDLLDSLSTGYQETSYYLRDHFMHPDQFEIQSWWTFDTPGGDSHCLVEFDDYQKGPYIRLNSPPASGELPNGLGAYLMRPNHMVDDLGYPEPIVTAGDPAGSELFIDVTAFDRDRCQNPGDPSCNGQGIREVALWLEGPENEEDGHSVDRNLLREGGWSEHRDWYELTSAPYEVTFDLSDGRWPDDSWVISGTHYLYIRAMDRDDAEGMERLFTLLVVPIQVNAATIDCSDLQYDDVMFFTQYHTWHAVGGRITNTTSFPATIGEGVFTWERGTSAEDGLVRYSAWPRCVDSLSCWTGDVGWIGAANYGDGTTDPWNPTSGWNYNAEIEPNEQRVYSLRFNGGSNNCSELRCVDVGAILDLPMNPWYPTNRMSPPCARIAYSDQHSFYRNDGAQRIGSNIVHSIQFEMSMRFDFPMGASCWLDFTEGNYGPAIRLYEPVSRVEDMSDYPSGYDGSFENHYYLRPDAVASYSSAPEPDWDNACYVAGDDIDLEMETWDVDEGGVGTAHGTGIQEVAVWVIGPNSRDGYRNLLTSGSTSDWRYLSSSEIAQLSSGWTMANVSGSWPAGSGYPVVNGRYYLFIRVMDDDDDESIYDNPYQPLYTLMVTSFDVCGGANPEPTPTPLAPTDTPTPQPPTHTPTPVTPTSTPTPVTPTNTPTATPTVDPSITPTSTPTFTPTPTPTPFTVTPTPTSTPTDQPIPTIPGGGD